MLEKVKVALRIVTPSFDGEVENLIAAAKADLGIAGVDAGGDEPPALVERALILYCKGHFGWNEESERYIKVYERLKAHLSLSGDYRAVE